MPWTPPLTRSGRSALVPDGPWTYVLDTIAVYAEGDPSKLEEALPDGVKATEELWFYLADIVSFSPKSPELNYEAPGLLQYREAAVFVKVELDGVYYAYCPFMYVDSDVSLVRGLMAGFPKKIAKIDITKDHELLRFKKLGGVASRAGYGLMKMIVEPERNIDKLPFDDFGPWLLRRYFAPIGVDELVKFVPKVKYGSIREGKGEMKVFSGINDELDLFEPTKVKAGYAYSVLIEPEEIKVVKKLA